MRKHNSARPHTTATRRARHTRVKDDAPARPNPRLLADAVIAGYIHDISRDGRHDARVRRAREARLRLDA